MLAGEMMTAIGEVVLAAEVFLAAGAKPVSTLEAHGAKLDNPRRDRRYANECGLRMLTLRHLDRAALTCRRASLSQGKD